MTLTLEKLSSYMSFNKIPSTYKISYDDFEVTVKNRLTIEEQQQFVEQVVANAYIDNITFSKPALEAAFDAIFVSMCTDIPVPMKNINDVECIDTQAVCDIVEALGLYKEIDNRMTNCTSNIRLILRDFVYERIQFENQKRIAVFAQSNATAEAIDTLNTVLNAGLGLINKAHDIIEKNGNKITKVLTPKKINEFINKIQSKYVESLKLDGEKDVIKFDPLQSK